MTRDPNLFHLTRDLVHRFFAKKVIDEDSDLHAYFQTLSNQMAHNRKVVKVLAKERVGRAEAWCTRLRLRVVVDETVVDIATWLRAGKAPQPIAHITISAFKRRFPQLAEFGSLEAETGRALSRDPRFMQDAGGRWFLWYAVSTAELDQMLALLESVEEGMALEELASTVVGVDACFTDAKERLEKDERFASVDGHWFTREQLCYSLTDKDVDRILEYLRESNTGWSLATLVRVVLERDVDLTNAQEVLREERRFHEVRPGVWQVAGAGAPLTDRGPLTNRPVRSKGITSVPAEDYTVEEEYTLRGPGPSGDAAGVMQSQITRTLSLVDVRSGSLPLGPVRKVTPLTDGEAILFRDDRGIEFTAQANQQSNCLAGLGHWFGDRELTFGDKVVIRPTDREGFLLIEPKGEQDVRVYREALERLDVEKAIASASQIHKSFHDLMIDVMSYYGQPLHREDIYDLVNAIRTASRNTIFTLLSLSDCPYEELRYFVAHGDGHWSFDLDRKGAFDMKMRDLLTKVEKSDRDRRDSDERVIDLTEKIERLKAENVALTDERETNQGRISTTAREIATLNHLITGQKDQIRKLREQVQAQDTEVVQLRDEKSKLDAWVTEAAKGLGATKEQRDELEARVEALLKDRTGLVERVETLEQRLVQLQAKADGERARAEADEASVRELEQAVGAQRQEVDILQEKLDRVRGFLRTPLGRGFVALAGLIGRHELSEI
jgi:predicted  nucleic acid-binding Zn-ribbon protein